MHHHNSQQDRVMTAQDRADLEEFLAYYDEQHRQPYYGNGSNEPLEPVLDLYKLGWWVATILANLLAWFGAWWIFANYFVR